MEASLAQETISKLPKFQGDPSSNIASSQRTFENVLTLFVSHVTQVL